MSNLGDLQAQDVKEVGPNAYMINEPMGMTTAVNAGEIRAFSTGATRDSDEGKNDYEGFLSPLVIEAYGDYMTEHRKQSDGSLRDSDNWQKGIPKAQYMKSLLRHVITAWKLHRGWAVRPEKIGGVLRVPTMRETLCAILFNTMGYLHELLKEDTAAAA